MDFLFQPATKKDCSLSKISWHLLPNVRHIVWNSLIKSHWTECPVYAKRVYETMVKDKTEETKISIVKVKLDCFMILCNITDRYIVSITRFDLFHLLVGFFRTQIGHIMYTKNEVNSKS